MKNTALLLNILLLIVILFACTTKVVTIREPVKPEARSPEKEFAGKEPWQVEWDQIVRSARKEGKVVIHSSAGGTIGQDLSRAFQRNFQIPVEWTSAPGAAGAARILSERRAGLYIRDVFIGGSATPLVTLKPTGALVPLEPALILPELTEPELIKKVWWRGGLRWLDKEHLNLAFLATVSIPVVINTDLIKYEEVKSYMNFLEPKWKGKIILHDPTGPGFGISLLSFLGDQLMGWDYVQKLSEQVALSRDSRQMVEWVTQGKYLIAIAPQTETVQQFLKAGAPLKAFVPVEGGAIASSSGTISLFKNAPNINAARLFINWLLTKEGQTIFSQAFGQPSARLDVTIEGLIPESIPQPGVNYFLNDVEEVKLKEPRLWEKAREIFSSLLK